MPLPNPYKSPLTIDGQAAILLIARLTVTESIAYRTKFRLFGEKAHRMAGLKKNAKTDADFDAQAARDLALQEEGAQFFTQTILDYVAVESGLVDDVGAPLRTGEDLLQAYGHREEVLREILAAVFLENSLSAAQKKTWRAAPASPPGSAIVPPDAGAAGATPAETVTSASSPAFKSSADAMASSVGAPSGPTAP